MNELINFDNIFVFFGGPSQQWDSKVYLKFSPPSRPRGCTKLFLINLINVGPTDPQSPFVPTTPLVTLALPYVMDPPQKI